MCKRAGDQDCRDRDLRPHRQMNRVQRLDPLHQTKLESCKRDTRNHHSSGDFRLADRPCDAVPRAVPIHQVSLPSHRNSLAPSNLSAILYGRQNHTYRFLYRNVITLRTISKTEGNCIGRLIIGAGN